jgi:hypothetical protein
MAVKTKRSKNGNNKRRKKVPVPIKVGIAVIGAFFILIALIGAAVHGQSAPIGTNITAGFNATAPSLNQLKGCVGNDQTSGGVFIKASCLDDSLKIKVLCDNWVTQGLGNPPTALCQNY